MEPISMIIGALVAGAVAASKDVAEQAIKDTYAGLRALLKRKFGESSKLARAVDDLDSDPQDKQYKESASHRIQEAEAHKDQEVVAQAKELLDLLKAKGEITEATYQVTVQGSGAAAVGPGATAAGERGVAIGGSVSRGTIITGNNNVADKNT